MALSGWESVKSAVKGEGGKAAAKSAEKAAGWFGKAKAWVGAGFSWFFTKVGQLLSLPINAGKVMGEGAAGATIGAGKATGKFVGSGAVWVLAQPVNVALHGLAGVIRFARGNPIAAGVTALVGGGAMVGGIMRDRAERRTRQQILEQAATAQQNQGNPYRLAPGEFDARVAPMMKDNGRQGGFAAAELAARDAAAQAAAAQK